MSAAVRRISLFLVVLAALALTGTAAAAATDPQLGIVAADQTWAESIVLAPADLGPGWLAEPNSGSSGDGSSSDPSCAASYPNESDLTITGVGMSPDFSRADAAYVSSYATIWQTLDQAQADWDRSLALSTELLNCLANSFTALSTKKVRIVVTSKGALTFPALAPRTAAYRIKLAFKATKRVKKKLKKISVPASYDVVMLGNGRATAMLTLFSLNKRPITAADEQSLAGVLAARLAIDPAAAPKT